MAIPGQNGHYQLTMSQGDIDKVIMFSDRPNRIVKTITADQLQAMWKVGKNSFQEDPPNAVLSASGHLPEIIELTDMVVSQQGQVSYHFTMTANQAVKPSALGSTIQNVVLTIDKA